MALPAVLDLSALAGARPPPIAGSLETSPGVRVRLHWQPGCNLGRGAWLADFHSAAGTPLLLARRVVLVADMWASHRIPAGDFPERVLRVRRNTIEQDVTIDGSLVTVDLRGVDPALLDLGSGAVTIEIDALA